MNHLNLISGHAECSLYLHHNHPPPFSLHSDFDFESLFGRSAESETLLSACFAVCGPRGGRKERDGDVSFVVSRRRFWPLSDEDAIMMILPLGSQYSLFDFRIIIAEFSLLIHPMNRGKCLSLSK